MTAHHHRPLPEETIAIGDPARQRRHAVTFLFVFALLCAVAIWMDHRLNGAAGGSSLAFAELQANEVAVTLGLTRAQESELKLNYLKSPGFVRPEIGMFGNHQARHFTRDAFAASGETLSFFNFWYANLGLPELRDYLAYVEHLGRLPSRMILVQITTPNNDNGHYIIHYGTELPAEIISHAQQWGLTNILPAARYYLEEWRIAIGRVFRYSTLILGALAGDRQIYPLDLAACDGPATDEAAKSALAQRLEKVLPGTVLAPLGGISSSVLCRERYLDGAFRADGSVLQRSATAPILDQNRLDMSARYLVAGDDDIIAKAMRDIDAIGRRNNIPVIFFVPPVYETERPSLVDAVFSAALAKAPGLNVVDHRHLRLDSAFYYHYDHPKEGYFELVVRDARHFLPEAKP